MEKKVTFMQFWSCFVSSGVDMRFGEAKARYEDYCQFIDNENIKDAK